MRRSYLMPIAIMAFSIVVLLLFMDISMGIFSNGTVTPTGKNTNTKNTNIARVAANSNANVSDTPTANTNSDLNTNTSAPKTTAYRNKAASIAFSYPNDLVVNECGDGMYTFVSAVAVPCDTEGTGSAFSVTRQETSNHTASIASLKTATINPVETAITIDGVVGVRVRGVSKPDVSGYDDGGHYKDVIFLTVDGVGYIVSSVSLTSSPFRATDFEEMVASLKFTPALASGWSRFTNTKYGYQFDYPKNLTVGSSEYGVAEASLSSTIDILKPGSGYPAWRLTVITTTEALRAYAEVSWTMNKNDPNPNYPDKQVGAFETITLNGLTGYSFTVTDSFKSGRTTNDGSGYVLGFPYRYTYLPGPAGKLYEIGYATDQPDFLTIYKSFRPQ